MVAKARREKMRWDILSTLNVARPIGASESLILTVLQSDRPDVSALDVRRELDYLEDRDLIQVSGKGTLMWRAEITRQGVDVVEYTVPCEPGIARPEQ